MGSWRAEGADAGDCRRKVRVGELVKSLSRYVAVFLAVMVVAGCSLTQEAGAAVIVGDQRLTTADLAAEYQGALDALPETSQGLGEPLAVNRAIIQSYVYSIVIDALAAEYKVSISDAQVAASRADLEKQYGKDGLLAVAAQGAIAPQAIDRQLRTSLTYRAIADKLLPGGAVADQDQLMGPKLVEMAGTLGITVAPRFGEWDATTIAVKDIENGLSIPASSLTALQG